MSQTEIRKKFFYAMSDAGLYDATIEWVAPHYKLMHQMMHQLVAESIRRLNDQPITVLDIGSGTGEDAITMLKAFPNINLVGLDLCSPMNTVFIENAKKYGISKERFSLIQGDILEPGTSKLIQEKTQNLFGKKEFNIITSAFTFHHFTTAQKADVFRLVQDLLIPGGIFLLGDLFNFGEESPWLTQTIFNWEVEWIANNFEQGANTAEIAGDTQRGAKLRTLKDQWVRHYIYDNKLDGVTTQLHLLRDAGFHQAGNPFRYWQVGLIVATK